MGKEEFDAIISRKYNDYYNVASKVIRKNKVKTTDESIVLSEAYLHTSQYLEILQTPGDVDSYMIKFISDNIRWYNSIVHKERQKSYDVNKISVKYDVDITEGTINYDKHIDEFKKHLSAYDTSLYRIYFTKQINSTPKIQKHIDVSYTQAYKILLECKTIEYRLFQFLKLKLDIYE